MRCVGKAGVVTGASRGLGREILLALCREGASVVAIARDENAGRLGVEEAIAAGGRAVFVQGDVRREEDVVAAIEHSRAELGALDFVVNNAGILGEGRLHEATNEQWDDLVATHLTGTFWGCKHAVNAMRESGGLDHQHRLHPLLHMRRLSRRLHGNEDGRLGLTKAIAIDYALDGIRCNCVCPGDMETPMIEQYFDGTDDPAAARAEMEAAYPGKRIAHPVEVAAAVVFLVSDESSFVNGTPILVDGGLTAKTY